MLRMIATRNFPYQGRGLKRGDVFEARDKTHARQLRSAGFAADAVKRGRPPKAESESEEPIKIDDQETAPKPRKAKVNDYQTRALSVED